ncbi:BTAD domain-containing putative transcriptional regulator [Sphaerimonospora cavernae]|uniref:BTAD domain-containing putative transcriptional regulator n=1 Tax=Sphaerimonospora cavernae TaxID=1740611 RepID=A0ABV6U6G9_9ACTN
MTAAAFRVLGPVELQAPGGETGTLPPSVRVLLARLALAPGRVVSVDGLTDALWGENLPADATNALQIRVSKLRRALVAAGVGGDVLVTRAPGYLLAVPAESVDAYRFEHLVGEARGAAARGLTGPALECLDEALRLWRGSALADVGETDWALAESARLAELRLGAVEDRLELLLETGRHVETVADLERLVADNPLRERLHRLLMLALYRNGRQADALTAYQALRHHLADELGIDPAPELQALAEAILRQQVPSQNPANPSGSSSGSFSGSLLTGSTGSSSGGTAPATATAAPVDRPPAATAPTSPAPASPVPSRAGSEARVEAAHADRLPQRLTSLIGRDDDMVTTLRRLAEARVVTLTGPGGVGKTTLALEIARGADDAIADRVHLIRLAALEAGAETVETFITELGLMSGGPGTDSIEAIAEHLGPGRTLLVVDNCEHVIDDVAALIERLVGRCPGLRVLATSREALAIPGEVQVAVGPLAVPDETETSAAISAAPAVQLFLDRARAVRPAFALDAETAPVVATICRQLDGMPLAIELAAARIKALSAADIAVRLRDRFSLLTAGPRTSEARHRTLRATLDWSHDLLSDSERRLLRRLAVFRGGWTVQAAEEVCAFGGIAPDEVLDLLFRLVDRSLVVPDPANGRFRLLVTVHEYARARLVEAGEAATCHDRHLDHYLRLAEELGPQVRSQELAWSRLTEEHDNFRAALDHAVDSGKAGGDNEPDRVGESGERDAVEIGFRLAGALVWFWSYGLRYEGDRALTALLETGGGSTAARALALQGIGVLSVYYPTPRSHAAVEESLALFEEIGDRRNAAISRLTMVWAGQYGGDADEYRRMIAKGRDELGDSDDGWWQAMTHYLEAALTLRLGEFEESARQWRHSIGLLRSTRDLMLGSAALAHLGVALREAGRHAEARAVLEEAVDENRRVDSLHGLTFALVHLAHTRLDLAEGEGRGAEGTDGETTAVLNEADEIARRARNPRCQAWAAWGRARIARTGGNVSRAYDECRRALTLLEEREFPWARARLWSFTAECAAATGHRDEAAQARHAATTVATTAAPTAATTAETTT